MRYKYIPCAVTICTFATIWRARCCVAPRLCRLLHCARGALPRIPLNSRKSTNGDRTRYSGFTLIELLIAISILAIVAILGWRGLDSIVRSREVLTSELEQTRSLQLTFAQLQSDCSQNVNPLSYPNLPEHRSSWIEPQRLILIRNEYMEDEAPAMQVVVYRLQNSNLTRFESIPTRDLAVLKQLLDQARNPPDNQIAVIMQKNVQNIEFTGYPESSLGPNSDDGNPPPDIEKKPPPDDKNPPLDKGGTPEKKPNPDAKEGSGDQTDDNIQKVNQNKVTTGLQVSLQLQNHDNKILKIFMLGGA